MNINWPPNTTGETPKPYIGDPLTPPSTTVQPGTVTLPGGHTVTPYPVWPPSTGVVRVEVKEEVKVMDSPKMNPKDALGMKKVSFTKFPPAALAHGAHAMMNGASKYGPYNWRGNAVVASIYLDACMRHLNAWFDGEETAEDSGVHHLGHAMACMGIILDAQETGNLIDDRPVGNQGAYNRLVSRLNEQIAMRNAAK